MIQIPTAPWLKMSSSPPIAGVSGLDAVSGAAPFKTISWRCFNRTGGALVVGAVYMLDLTVSQAETTNYLWDSPASVWRNVVSIGTMTSGAGTAQVSTLYTGIYCVATTAAADNVEAEFIFASPAVDVLTVAAVNTHFLPKWSGLTCAAGVAPNATINGGSGHTNRQIGRSLVAVDNASATVGVLRSCMIYGFGMN